MSMGAIKEITYLDRDGRDAKAVYYTGLPLTARSERFCQLVAFGATQTDAFLEAYEKAADYDRHSAAEQACHLMQDTDVLIRVQELKRPVLKKFRQKFEYNLQKALEQCQTAWDLAYAQGDAKGLLKAIELQGRFAKLLTEQVHIKHEHALDDASTGALLEMLRQIEDRKTKAEKKIGEIVTVESVAVPGPPRPPLST
jgi:hypothetical protein